MKYNYFTIEKENRVAIVKICNPPVNFFRMGMVFELSDMFDAFEYDDEVGAVVITGGIKDYFIAHADLEKVILPVDPDNPKSLQFTRKWHDTFTKIQHSPKVVIAAINGQALGGGCELALACDFRFMAKGHRIGQIEIQLGILPGGGGSQRMVRLLGPGKALQYMLEGTMLDADEAERAGLIHRAIEPDKLLDYSIAYGQRLAKYSPTSIKWIKRCVYDGLDMPINRGLEIEANGFMETMRTEQAINKLNEAINAYKQGKKPDFQ